jgi:predicted MFS family arabinose efflux permease
MNNPRDAAATPFATKTIDAMTSSLDATLAPPASKRWLVLGLFMAVMALSQVHCVNFVPLVSEVQRRYGVSELVASSLTLVFPLVYVLLSVHAGKMTDRRGYKFTVGLGAVLLAVSSSLRIPDAGFPLLLVAQTGAAISQPYVVNGISRLVADWFPPEHTALATGLGTMGMFLGLAVGIAATAPLVTAVGWSTTMGVYAALSALAALAFWLLVQERTPVSAAVTHPPLGKLLKRPQLVLLFAASFVGMGFFNGFTTWLEPILAPHGFDAEQAGEVGGLLIVGGIVGSVVIPALSDALRRRKPILVVSCLLALMLFAPVVTSQSATLVLASAAAMGFFWFPTLALLLALCAANVDEADAGSATGLLMMFGNAGGVVIALLMVLVKGDEPTFDRALFVLAGAIALTLLACMLLRETAAAGSTRDSIALDPTAAPER